MSKIFKSVSMRETPLVIAHVHPAEDDAEPEETEEAAGEDDPVAAALAEADGEAARIIAAAHDKAAAIIADAQQKAEEHFREAGEAGRQEGFEAGVAAGKDAGLAQASNAIEEALARAQAIVAAAQKQADEELVSAERQIVELAMATARKILAREIEENPYVILPIVKAALEKVRDQEKVTIRVHPDSYEFLLAAKPELQASLARDIALTVVADSSLKDGDCVVETPYGLIDARIDTQFEILKTALQDIMP